MDLPWIKLYVDLPRHPKMRHLRALIGPMALDHTVRALCYLAEYAAHGDTSAISVVAFESACEWTGERGALISAWRESGFIDEDGHWHGWAEVQEAHVNAAHKRAGAAQRKRAQRARDQQSVTVTPGHTDVTRDMSVTDSDVTRDPSLSLFSSSSDQDPDRIADSVPTEAREPEPKKPSKRPEPLGPYGEVIPETADGVLDFRDGGEPLGARWAREHPALTRKAILREVEKAMALRETMPPQKFRAWNWPRGFILSMDDWLKRAETTELNLQAAKARAAWATGDRKEAITSTTPRNVIRAPPTPTATGDP